MGALLALLALSIVVFVSCGVPGTGSDAPDPPPLDEAAQRACAVFLPVAEDIRSGALTGPPLFRTLQDAFNEARRSKTEGFSDQVRGVYSTAIGGDQAAVAERVTGLQSRCAAD